MKNSGEPKRAINTRTGVIRMLPWQIYSNPVRMQSRDWQLMEEPQVMKPTNPVAINVPTRQPVPPEGKPEVNHPAKSESK